MKDKVTKEDILEGIKELREYLKGQMDEQIEDMEITKGTLLEEIRQLREYVKGKIEEDI